MGKMVNLLLVLTIITICSSSIEDCHPACIWECNSPPCFAKCRPICLPPACQRCKNESGTISHCKPLHHGCSISCPPDQCELDHCPECALSCGDEERKCRSHHGCLIICEEVECAWFCEKPNDCAEPTCQLNCEHPACETTSSSSSIGGSLQLLTILSLIRWILNEK
jgi:hypothetical protein